MITMYCSVLAWNVFLALSVVFTAWWGGYRVSVQYFGCAFGKGTEKYVIRCVLGIFGALFGEYAVYIWQICVFVSALQCVCLLWCGGRFSDLKARSVNML